jgi:hypothetical protein
MRDTLHGLVAEFETPGALTEAVRIAQSAGYTRLDAYSPYPMPELADALDAKTLAIPLAALVVGIAGAAVQYYAQYWMNVLDYPINVGGRPLHSWPAFIPGPLIVSFLWAAVAILVAFLTLTGLPRLHHPIFDVIDFERASEDRFFLCLERGDPMFDREGTARFLENLRPLAVREIFV